jgi:hypothetical protein
VISTVDIFSIFTSLNAQTGFLSGAVLPLKPQSPLFGKDITIYDRPTNDQRHPAMCCAFNGWLYIAQASDSSGYPFAEILKSIDNGISWTRIVDVTLSYGYIFTDLDLVVIGNSVSDLKLFLGATCFNPYANYGFGSVTRYNGVTGGAPEIELLDDYPWINDLALAIDYPYPANNTTPSSLAVLYSVQDWGNTDSIVFRTSSDGGVSLNNRECVAFTHNHFNNVSLSYGYSTSWNSGRYFAAWEEKDNLNSTLGHIYTAHTSPDFNSPFTIPVKLDSIDPTALNRCRNPVISCQVSSTDNDSANMTEVVLFEKKKLVGNDYDITGYYNLQSATTSHFRILDVAATLHNELQPDIVFNPFDSTLMVTYYDSTTQKLPFITKNFNMVNPNSWNAISQGYNDSPVLTSPYPKVQINYNQQKGANVWIKEGTNGNGVAMFDAPYSTYTGISTNSTGSTAKLIASYPNPCSNTIKISFELQKPGKVIIDVLGILGQPLGTVTDQIYSDGRHVVEYDVSGLKEGSYLYKFRAGEFRATGKFVIIR